jgi:hypothetical protein
MAAIENLLVESLRLGGLVALAKEGVVNVANRLVSNILPAFKI